MTQDLQDVLKATAGRINDFMEIHKNNDISLHDHILSARHERAKKIASKRIIYLDTNAWKCLADHYQGKDTLTASMIAFALAMKEAQKTGRFIFPIGLSTFFELDSMTDPNTHESLVSFIDDLCQGYCLAPFSELLIEELEQINYSSISTAPDLALYLRSPMELLGIPDIVYTAQTPFEVDQNTFRKAFYDAIMEIPFSTQLSVARNTSGPKWDNKQGILELNEGKTNHQADIPSLNVGIFVELKGIIETCFEMESIEYTPKKIGLIAVFVFQMWHSDPTTRALPTLRLFATLHGLIRFDKQRKYQQGDLADFMAAASALPVAEAMFTDRRLAIILQDSSLGLRKFSDCKIVKGFEDMARYLIE